MIINHNLGAMNAHRQMGANQNNMQNSMEKLSSGLRINSAADDAAGLAISEKMRGQIRGLEQADRNAQDGISMIQTAEGALNETHDILQRMRELAVQAGNDTNVDADRGEIQKEMDSLTSEINRIGNTTEFNTKNLLDGGANQTGGNANSFHQATAASAATAAGDFSGDSSTITINGTTATLDGDYGDVDGVAAELNSQFDGTGITFSNDSGTLSASGAEEFTIEVTEGTATTGFADDASSSEVSVEFSATAASAATAAGDFSGDSSTITINGTTATLDGDYGDVDGVAAELNSQFDGTGITFSNDSGTLSASGAEEFTIEVTEGTATTGFADDATATSNVPAGLELSGGTGEGFSANFQIGANQGQSTTIEIADMRANALGISGSTTGPADGVGEKAAGAVFTASTEVTDGTNNTGSEASLDVSSHENAAGAVEVINQAIEKVSAQRSELGASQNRLEHTISNLGNAAENLSAAESRIRDVDMAKEMMEMTSANILSQASQSMLAQANQQPQSVLQLLG